MFVENEFFVRLRDVEKGNKLSNTALLSYLEDIGGIHSNIAGYGLNDIPKVKCTWILLNWKIKLFSRPFYNEKLKIKTWCRKLDRLYAFRDFEIFNENDERIGIATSKWVLINIETGKLLKLGDKIATGYGIENVNLFNEGDIAKLIELPEFDIECNFKITKNLIDVNKHVHNIYYLDIAKEVIPDDIYAKNDFNYFEIMCKKEIKYGEEVKCLFKEDNDSYNIMIKSKDKNALHSIIKLYK